jgi:hypothetical protein
MPRTAAGGNYPRTAAEGPRRSGGQLLCIGLGNKVKISFKGGPQLTVDVKQGAADLVITGTEQVDNLVKTGESRGVEARRQHT